MSKRWAIILAVCGLVVGWALEPVVAAKGKGGVKQPVLTEAESRDLLFLREEEKLAHDVYATLHAEYGRRIFENISESESRHMEAVLGLLGTYGLDDPALDFGLFANEELQTLFDALVASGLGSELDALMAGALIEEVDIEDLAEAMARTDKADILNVYTNLVAGSENHLRAFVRNIEAITGESYTAQVLPQEEVDAILGR